MVLKTKRLFLRPWSVSDTDRLFELASDPDVGPHTGWTPHRNREGSRRIIENVLNGKECYAICSEATGEIFGTAGLMLNGAKDDCELGYWLGKKYWGNGYMTEAVRELIRHAFRDLGMSVIWCCYSEGNDRSRRVQEKSGFRFHHTDENCEYPLINEVRTRHVSFLSADEWEKNIQIRPLEKNETKDAIDLAKKVFSEFEAPDYGEAGIEHFSNSLNDAGYLNGIRFYGAFNGSELVGMLGFREKTRHICLLFVDGKYHRLGIGTRLFREAYKNHEGKSVTVNASPYGLPFYQRLGFVPGEKEQIVNGLRFTPMILNGTEEICTVTLSDRQDMAEYAAEWFSSKWEIPYEEYISSITQSFSGTIPSWYICLDGEKIVAGAGVIENDFHDRKDLTPNVCAVYTEPWYRNQGIAGRLLNRICRDMSDKGIDTLYLVTDLEGFYERYGWERAGQVRCDGNGTESAIYIHHSIHEHDPKPQKRTV